MRERVPSTPPTIQMVTSLTYSYQIFGVGEYLKGAMPPLRGDMFRLRQQKTIFRCVYCNSPSAMQIEATVPLRNVCVRADCFIIIPPPPPPPKKKKKKRGLEKMYPSHVESEILGENLFRRINLKLHYLSTVAIKLSARPQSIGQSFK